jgi:isoleucyl-tRNA synthetase
MDYKETLNLPKTDFPMKANLTEREPEILKKWSEGKIYEQMQEKNKNLDTYILHDGPPYANGNIHIGHALNKILKDIIVKFKSMEGYRSPYVPGWDCHGLPIEHQVDKNLGSKKETIPIEEKRRLCREYADRYFRIQRDEFVRLGVFGDWENPYLTMDYSYEANIVREFGKFVGSGIVYKGRKPIHWCPTCVTALAEAEVEYMDHESPSVYVKFKLRDKLPFSVQRSAFSVYFIIWTTTPWTLPANLGLCLHPDYDYVAIEIGNEVYILAERLLNSTIEKLGIKNFKIIEKFKGKILEGLKASHPFIDRDSVVILGEHVTLDQGTGVVHTAPGHGEEDYEMGLKYNLDIYSPVDEKGKFTEEVEDFSGQYVFKANKGIIDKLKIEGMLLHEERIVHSYPHCWRCKNPVIFRATSQWFISMDKNDLRKRAINGIDSVRWIPSWGKDRIYGMVENRPDWCISRQRSWGVPITIFSCKKCGEYLMDKSLVDYVAGIIDKKGADVWFTEDSKKLLPDRTKCPKCASEEFRKEKDILDVWFDSGVSHAAVLRTRPDLRWPADLYLEGSDQHRGWFQSSLLASLGTGSDMPYRSVLTHGFVVDGEGKKMSKSAGNVIAPQEVISKHGAEILRLWVSAEDYKEDVRISSEILTRLIEAYRKIRNTCRYLLGNLYDFDPDLRFSEEDLLEIDRWALARLQRLTAKVQKGYRDFEFYTIFHSIYNFCTVDMSATYLDILKDRLYTFRADSPERKSAQWTMYKILTTLTKLMAPILSFTAEEVWRYIPKKPSVVVSTHRDEESVFLSKFPEVEEKFLDDSFEQKWQRFFQIRDEVNKALETARKNRLIGSSLEADVSLYLSEELYKLLSPYKGLLPTLFIVSGVLIKTDTRGPQGAFVSDEVEGLNVFVNKAEGNKCERCWNYSVDIGKDKGHPTICPRCIGALR